MNKQKVKFVLVELGLFALQVLISRVEVFGLSPAGFPFAMLRIFYSHNIFVVTVEYLISKIWTFVQALNFLVVGFELVILALYYFALEFFKTKKKRLMMICFVIVSTAFDFYFSISSLQQVVLCSAGLVFKLALTLYFFKLFELFKKKFLFFKFSNFDYLMFSVFVFLIATGLFGFSVVRSYGALCLSCVVVLFLVRILPAEKFFIVTSMYSFALTLVSGNIFYLIFVGVMSVLMFNFKQFNKYWFAVASLVYFSICVPIFKIYSIISYFSLIFAVFLVIIIPQKWVLKLQLLFEQDALQILLLQKQENKILNLKSKLEKMSQTFELMKNNLKMLLVGKIDRMSASASLVEDVVGACCIDCENYQFCFKQNINKKVMLEKIVFQAIEKGEIEESYFGNGLQTYCIKKGELTKTVNQAANLYLSYESAMKGEDQSKLVIASEFENFADIFLNFAKIIENNEKINQKTSKRLKECIFNAMIDVKEVLVFESETGIKQVCVVSQNENLLKQEMVQVIEKVTKIKVRLKEIKHLEVSGLGFAVFEPAGRFKLEVAVSSKSKEMKNGDNVVVSKISDTKYFVALADGMGHGEGAHKVSKMVLSLVKSMFEVGIDNDLVIESVNKLLIPAGLDNFSTLDACVIDLENEICNFIKLGSSVSVIKHRNTSEIISSSSLPIGLVQNIKPQIISRSLCFGDVIFLASDGVVDSFESPEEFKAFINDTKIYNLQKHLDNVIFDAEYQTKHLDDMTIIGINLLKN